MRFTPINRALLALSSTAMFACSTPTGDGDGTSDTSTNIDTDTSTAGDATTETGDEQPAMGLPEGQSTWSGTLMVNGLTFPTEVTIDNTNGDLTATATYMDNPEMPVGIGEVTQTLTGTYDPGSHRLALAPNEWIMEAPVPIELLGMSGTYDPETQTIGGMVNDYVSPSSPEFMGGPVTLTLVDGPGEPTEVGDEGARFEGSQMFSGTHQCTGPVRDIEGELVHDGAGGVTGSVTIGDPDLGAPLGTFEFSGVHNPTTGGVTLVPGSWVGGSHNTLGFFVDGTYDPANGSFDGDGRVQIGPCPPGQWQVSFP